MSDLLNGLADDYITCWTVQDRRMWATLCATGRYRVADEHIEQDYKSAYEWLCRQMLQRIPKATGSFPVWAYARATRESLRMLLQYRPEQDPTEAEEEMLLTCRIPAKEVLLSDYDAWHLVLNNDVLILDDDPAVIDRWYDSMEERLTPSEFSAGMRINGAYPPAVQRELEASWEHIFNIEYWIGLYPHAIIQATFEELRLEHVVRAVPLGRPGVSANRRIANLVRYL